MNIGCCTTSEKFELLNKLPQPVIQSVMNDFKNTALHKCIAIHNVWGNKFSVSLPFDIEFTFNKETNEIIINQDNTSLVNNEIFYIITNKSEEYTKNPVIQISLMQFFVADSDCIMTVMPPINEMYKDMWRNIKLVSGSFNIYDWHRNMNFAFEWINYDKPLIIKKGEPIMYLQFNTPNLKESFKINKIPLEGEVKKSYLRCTGARGLIKNNTQELLDNNRVIRPDKLMSKCPYSKFKRLFKKF
jgi:hypothetical protein